MGLHLSASLSTSSSNAMVLRQQLQRLLAQHRTECEDGSAAPHKKQPSIKSLEGGAGAISLPCSLLESWRGLLEDAEAERAARGALGKSVRQMLEVVAEW